VSPPPTAHCPPLGAPAAPTAYGGPPTTLGVEARHSHTGVPRAVAPGSCVVLRMIARPLMQTLRQRPGSMQLLWSQSPLLTSCRVRCKDFAARFTRITVLQSYPTPESAVAIPASSLESSACKSSLPSGIAQMVVSSMFVCWHRHMDGAASAGSQPSSSQ